MQVIPPLEWAKIGLLQKKFILQVSLVSLFNSYVSCPPLLLSPTPPACWAHAAACKNVLQLAPGWNFPHRFSASLPGKWAGRGAGGWAQGRGGGRVLKWLQFPPLFSPPSETVWLLSPGIYSRRSSSSIARLLVLDIVNMPYSCLVHTLLFHPKRLVIVGQLQKGIFLPVILNEEQFILSFVTLTSQPFTTVNALICFSP